ncbi:MAG: arylsulfatase [Pirellulales bacterium]
MKATFCQRVTPALVAVACFAIATFAGAAKGFAQPASEAVEDRPPNFVFFLADDLGYGELGCYGQKWIRTPNIDAIAAEGLRFTQFYAGNAVCAPSRCCLMTGKHPGHAYIRNNGNPEHLQHLADQFGWEFPGQYPIPDEEVTLAEVLKSKGYATAAIGKWGLGHFGTTGDPNRQGFDLFYGFNCQVHAHNHYPRFLWRNGTKETLPGNDRTLSGETYSQDQFIEEAIAFVRANRDRPFLLYMPFTIPHLSIQAPEESVAQYRDRIPEEDYEHGNYLKHPTPRAGYAAMVTHMDRGIGQVMALLKELGLEENTLVMFSSDNGPTYSRLGGADSAFFNSAGPLRGRKGNLYEAGIRVPLVARWPGKIAPGRVTEQVAAFWDVLPTLAELADTEPSDQIDGISFAPTLLDRGDQRQHDYLYWEFPAYGGQQAVRKGDWKAVRLDMMRRNNPDPLKIELYNLASDVGESQDIAADHPEMVDQMRNIMREARTPSELFPLRPLDRQ